MPHLGGYIDVDRLQAETTLADAAAKCGFSLDVKGNGPEVRIDCPFGCPGEHAGRKELAVNAASPHKVFQCHAYQCGFRGNLLSLMHGFLTGAKPSGGKLKGEEFQRVKRVLAGAAPPTAAPPAAPSSAAPSATTPARPAAEAPPLRNVPFAESADPRLRELHNLDEKLIRDPAHLNPAAAAYLRRHPSLSPESLAKWRSGYLRHDGGGDKRGWSLRGHLLYPVLSEHGGVLAWVGRDVEYEKKEQAFAQLAPAERAGQNPPAKHRFPKGFHRSLELFGQHAARLQEPGYREFLRTHGLILVEGFNDVIALDNLGVPALAVMSNRLSEAQGAKVLRFARQLAAPRVNLMFDCDPPGTEGAREALWFFAERRLDARLLWSAAMDEGRFRGLQPEGVTADDLHRLLSARPRDQAGG